MEDDVGPVVESGAADGCVVDAEAESADEVERRARGCAEARGAACVLGYFGFDENDVHFAQQNRIRTHGRLVKSFDILYLQGFSRSTKLSYRPLFIQYTLYFYFFSNFCPKFSFLYKKDGFKSKTIYKELIFPKRI